MDNLLPDDMFLHIRVLAFRIEISLSHWIAGAPYYVQVSNSADLFGELSRDSKVAVLTDTIQLLRRKREKLMKKRIHIDIQDGTDEELAIAAVHMLMTKVSDISCSPRVYDGRIEVPHPRSNYCMLVHYDYIVDGCCRIFRVWTHR